LSASIGSIAIVDSLLSPSATAWVPACTIDGRSSRVVGADAGCGRERLPGDDLGLLLFAQGVVERVQQRERVPGGE
jgi:hypothetical protein